MSSSSLLSLPTPPSPPPRPPEAEAAAAAHIHLPDIERLLLSSLKKSPARGPRKELHALSIKTNLIEHPQVLTQFLLLQPPTSYSLPLLLSLPSPSTYHYNLLLSSLSRSPSPQTQALTLPLFSRMMTTTTTMRSAPLLLPDPFTLPPLLRSAPSPLSVLQLHSLSLKLGLLRDLVLRTALLDAYCSFRLPSLARSLFDRAPGPTDPVFWNTMIAGHASCGDVRAARELFDRMPHPNASTYSTVVDMHCEAGDIGLARDVFDGARDRDTITWNAMLSGYARAGDWRSARELFDSMPRRNVVSWNVLIGCYANNRMFAEALELFRSMQGSAAEEEEEEVEPNEVTVVTVLPVCAHLGALDLGRWIHAYAERKRIKMDLFVTTALVDMYGRCGSLDDARRAFDRAGERDVFLYNTMIEVLARHGSAAEAFDLFDRMRGDGIGPNDVTFVGLLKACAHVGSVEVGVGYFEMMRREFGLVPKVEHFGCMVDLLGRAGRLDDAHKLITGTSTGPSPVLWASLLSSCRIHGNVKLAEEAALHLMELEPESCGNYVLLSNVYSEAGRWESAAKLRKAMKEKGVSKQPGCSSIEIGNKIYEFFAGDRDHHRCADIYSMLDKMVARLKGRGYEPRTSSALHDVGRDGREKSLIHHSEKLALAFALISSEEGSTVRIVKNLRVCDDCHSFLKLASECYGREVVVRDRHRFHHFRDGSCSCLDYW